MKNNITCLPSEDLEINCSPILLKSSFAWLFLHGFWKKLIKVLITDPNELQVSQKVDRHGNMYWQAYDPVTQKSFSSGSQADVSMWIEQLYRY